MGIGIDRMIVFDLKCGQDHRFEAWFRNGETYEVQAAAGEIACPACGDTHVAKAPMAPKLVKARGEPSERVDEAAVRIRRVLGELRDHVEKTADYVGERFPEEARRIHYGETTSRPIYGEASTAEAEALKEEGVEVASIPWLPRSDS